MAEVIKTKYMDKATRGYSEYIARDLDALQTISPKEGDRAILLDGSLYICVDNGIWDIAGGAKETDILIITAGYKRGYTIDKTYAEIYSAAQAGKTIIMIDPIAFAAAGELPIILTPYSFNSDGSGTFVTIAKGDDMGGSKDYRYSITVYPDNTVIPRWEEFSQELDHTVTFKVDGEPYEIVSVKAGNSVLKPYSAPEKIEEGLICDKWENSNGELISFPYKPTGNISLFGVWNPSFDGLFLLSCDSLPLTESVNALEPSVNKITDIADGKFNKAIVLDNKRWVKYESDIFRVGLNDFTLECWAKPNDMVDPHGKLFSWYNGSNGDGFMTLKKDIVIWVERGTAVSANINIDDGQFHHIAFVRHNKTNHIYVDGVMVAQSTVIKNLTNRQLFIGINGATAESAYVDEYFDGLVDEIAFFDYAKYTQNFEPRKSAYIVKN